MTIHFYLERKELKKQDKAIYCYIRGFQNGKTIILNTKERINPVFWDKEQELATEKGKFKYPGAKELNDFLNSYREEINRTIRSLLANEPTAEYEKIKSKVLERFGKVVKVELPIFQALDKFIEIRAKDMSINSIRKYRTIKNQLKDFEKNKRIKLSFPNVDLNFYDDFLSYLLDTRQLVNNSAYKVIGLLKIFLKWSYQKGHLKIDDFKRFKVKEEKVYIISLTETELEKLIKLDLILNERLEKVRDVFVFGCYTGGRFSDLSNIGWTDIKDGVWHLWVKKTREFLKIPLIGPAKVILDKYKNCDYPLPRISNQKLNKYLKEVCKLADLKEMIKIEKRRGNNVVEIIKPKYDLVTTHSARRTFITQSLLKGMNADMVMSISGHKNHRTFKRYIDFTIKDKEEALNKAWNNNLLPSNN